MGFFDGQRVVICIFFEDVLGYYLIFEMNDFASVFEAVVAHLLKQTG